MKNKVLAVLALVAVLAMTAGCGKDNAASVSTDVATPTESVAEETVAEATPVPIDPNAMTIDTLMRKGNMSVGQHQSPEKFGDIEATVADGKSTWEGLTFYIFESPEKATEAFTYIEENVLQDTNRVDNTIIGQRAEAVGLPYIQFYYVTGNMIISRDDFIGDPGSDKGPSDKLISDNQAVHDNIVNFW